MILLSILIPTLTARKHLYERLEARLTPQLFEGEKTIAQIIKYEDDGTLSVGAKRNELVKQCDTPYACFVDDDDDVESDYVKLLTDACKQSPDCVTFIGLVASVNHNTPFVFRIGYPYDAEPIKTNAGYLYRRPPNHLCAIQTEILKQFPFPEKDFAEDYEQCLSMQKAGVLKTEVHIDKILYYYFYSRKKEY